MFEKPELSSAYSSPASMGVGTESEARGIIMVAAAIASVVAGIQAAVVYTYAVVATAAGLAAVALKTVGIVK
jgi:hypothetical protein